MILDSGSYNSLFDLKAEFELAFCSPAEFKIRNGHTSEFETAEIVYEAAPELGRRYKSEQNSECKIASTFVATDGSKFEQSSTNLRRKKQILQQHMQRNFERESEDIWKSIFLFCKIRVVLFSCNFEKSFEQNFPRRRFQS